MIQEGRSERVIVQMAGIRKAYRGKPALSGASFSLCAGEIHALTGANAAGKSLLMKILAGMEQADEGELRYLAAPTILFRDRESAEDAGIYYVQRGHLPGTQSENELLLQRVRALWREAAGGRCRVLILDEPTAVLTSSEREALFLILAEIRQYGTGIVYITHRSDEIAQIADRVTVMEGGRNVGTWTVEEWSVACKNEAGVTMSCSATDVVDTEEEQTEPSLAETKIADNTVIEEPDPNGVLWVRHLFGGDCAPEVRDVTFTLRRSEVLGLSGISTRACEEITALLQTAVRGADTDPDSDPKQQDPADESKASGQQPSGQASERITLLGEKNRILVFDIGDLPDGEGQKDSRNSALRKRLRDLTRKGGSVLVCTPRITDAMELCDRILMVSDGIIAGEIRLTDYNNACSNPRAGISEESDQFLEGGAFNRAPLSHLSPHF